LRLRKTTQRPKGSKIILFVELNAIDAEDAVYINDLCNYLSSAGIEMSMNFEKGNTDI